MTVTVRSKISAGRTGRYREGHLGRVAERSDTGAHPGPTTKTTNGHTAASRRRQAGAPQDQALYSCGCGYVFAAAVSTSVDCPHCGDTQAW
jgi:hypothetical protein